MMRPDSQSNSSHSVSHRSLCDICRPCFESICECSQQTEEEAGLLLPQEHEDVSQIPQFVSKFYSPLKTGTIIEVRGFLPEDSERFAINLCSGEASEDIAFHFNPRLSQNYIARNSRRGGEWGREESASALPFHIAPGKEFVIIIFVAKDDYLVSVNGKHFCGFAFRAPLKTTRLIRVTGDARDVRVQQRTSDVYPEVKPEIREIGTSDESGYYAASASSSEFLPVPYLANIPQQFLTGRELQIRGRVKILPHSFLINLQNSPYIFPHPEIILHINPRFGEVGGVHSVIRNSWLNGSWGPEERTPIKNFCPGKEFTLSIKVAHNYFTLFLNDIIIAEYQARADVDLAKFLYIQGDVELHNIGFSDTIGHSNVYTSTFEEEE